MEHLVEISMTSWVLLVGVLLASYPIVLGAEPSLYLFAGFAWALLLFEVRAHCP